MFTIDPLLQKDTFFIKDLKLCQLLLMNNSLYPWFILVPKKAGLTEIIDLSKKDRALLMEEIALVSKVLQHHLQPKKLNVANLGNVVSQLHIHIIARFEDDLTFPKPIWGHRHHRPYKNNELKKVIEWINQEIAH